VKEYKMANQVVWVDIPVSDLDRAVRFYSSVLGAPVKKQETEGMTIGMLPGAEEDVRGCLYRSDKDRPSDHGPLLYLDCTGRLDDALKAVPMGGGKVIDAKKKIGQYGFRAVILDSEGNRIALHSR
jgi:predicted enzyme related to lactoylglutathione lyase